MLKGAETRERIIRRPVFRRRAAAVMSPEDHERRSFTIKNALLLRSAVSVFFCVAGTVALGCSSDEADDSPAKGPSSPFSGCEKGKSESDMAVGTELSGPGVDPQTKRLRAGSYVIAATYLPLKPEVEVETVFGLTEPVIAELKTSKGMAAVTYGNSTACHALRTLTVWESEEDLGAFVMGPAHLSAMSYSSVLSRGTGNTISWEGTEKDVTWEAAAQQLASEQASDF